MAVPFSTPYELKTTLAVEDAVRVVAAATGSRWRLRTAPRRPLAGRVDGGGARLYAAEWGGRGARALDVEFVRGVDGGTEVRGCFRWSTAALAVVGVMVGAAELFCVWLPVSAMGAGVLGFPSLMVFVVPIAVYCLARLLMYWSAGYEAEIAAALERVVRAADPAFAVEEAGMVIPPRRYRTVG